MREGLGTGLGAVGAGVVDDIIAEAMPVSLLRWIGEHCRASMVQYADKVKL